MPHNVKLSYLTVPHAELEYARQCMALNSEPAFVQALITERTGITLSEGQLRCAGRGSNKAASEETQRSPAERLVNYLRNEESLDFILLVHENTATKLLTITRTGKCRGTTERNEYCTNDTDANTLSYAESIRNSLGLSGNTKLLLGAAWASHQQQRIFTMFPETLCADVTMGTNAEKRPLLVMTSKTSENKIVRIFQAFMPSQCRWIFDWCFRDAFVNLHGRRAIERNRVILTDGDSQMYSPLIDLTNDNQSPWRNSRHMLCMWHLINRGLKHQHLSDGRLSPLGKTQFGSVQNWMYSLSDSPETSEEFELSLMLLYKYLQSNEVLDTQAMGKVMAEALTNFIMTSIVPKKASVAFFVKLRLRCFNIRTTSNVESESSTIKKHPMGPRPFHGIDRSCAALSTILSKQMNKREMDAASAMDLKNIRRQLVGDTLTEHGASLLSAQYYSRLGYTVRRIDEHTFLLKKMQYTGFAEDDVDKDDASHSRHVIPQFSRVRDIKLVEPSSDSSKNAMPGPDDRGIAGLKQLCLLVCSCGYFNRFGITCRHVYAVLAPQNNHAANPPATHDAAVSWRKDYLYYHGRDEKLTLLYDDARDMDVSGGTWANKQHIDQHWPVPVAAMISPSDQLQLQYFLREHNENSTSTLLRGTKWNPCSSPTRRESTMEESCHLTQNDRPFRPDSFSLLGSCSQEMSVSRNDLDLTSPAADDESIPPTGGGITWDVQQGSGRNAHSVLGRNVYTSNLSLYTQVTNFAEGNPEMAHELTIGLQTLLSNFIEQRNRGETASLLGQGEFASLPQIDKSKKNKRLKPVLSPEKRCR